jgi:protein-ribulosamine 3-kinase
MLPPEILIPLESGIGKITDVKPVGGGSINQCFRLCSHEHQFFCKINSASKFPRLFEKEIAGLAILRANKLITPEVIACFTEIDLQVLVMEWIDPGLPDINYWKILGEGLAALHSVSPDHFGFGYDNYMGSVPQQNLPSEKWTTFFINRRLRPLLEKCSDHFDKATLQKFERFFKKLPEIYPDKKPSLLHGDLWSGNLLCNKNKQPVLIDPAVYYGHHSIDIGMTNLFGGFHDSFMDAYRSCIHTDPNFSEQCEVSNLYPLLIHLFLFGGQYRRSIDRILKKYTT